MIPELTLGTAAAGMVGSLGALLLFNGFRGAFVDEVVSGSLLLFVAWFILDMGALL